MPNNVKNVVVIDGLDKDSLHTLMEKIKLDIRPERSEKNALTLDFNKVIPMPKSLDIDNSAEAVHGIELFLTWQNPNVTWYGKTDMPEEYFAYIVRKLNAERMFGEYKTALNRKEISDLTKIYDEGRLMDYGRTCTDNVLCHGATNWYHWRTSSENWNTKWNAYDFVCTGADNIIEFSTAWSPPTPIIRRLSKMAPCADISHSWADEDLASNNCGKLIYRNGRVVADLTPHSAQTRAQFSSDLWCTDLTVYGNICLNATETEYIKPNAIYGDLIRLDNKYALWTDEHLRLRDIPKGLFPFYIFGNEEKAYITPFCPKNGFIATVISKDPLFENQCSPVEINVDDDITFTGNEISCDLYLERDYYANIYDEDLSEEEYE